MKAVIPAAGVGTRLRPHTLNKPKALLPVAGKPILAHIVDDLAGAGIDEFVIIVGYHGQAVRDWFAAERPQLTIRYIEQERRLGLGHAIWTAREALGDEPFFCVLGDTILKADYAALLACPQNMIAVREVEDPRRFGVVVLEGELVTGFVEKPADPPSNLAIVGAYLFHDAAALWTALDRVVHEDVRTRGEYQLTDGLQFMLQSGAVFHTVVVDDWFDCGKADTWLATNRVLLDRAAAGRESQPATPDVVQPCVIAPGVVITGSRVGPYVTVGAGARIEHCELRDCVIGSDTQLVNCRLQASLVGGHCRVEGVRGEVNIGDHCEVKENEEE